MITKNHIEVKGEHLRKSERSRLIEVAEKNISVKPNSNYFFFFPKERASLKYRFEADTPRWTSWMMRIDGEEATLADTSRLRAVTENLRRTLQSEGYYDATTDYSIEYRKKTAHVVYELYPHEIYRLDSFSYLSADSSFAREIDQLESRSYLRKGRPVSATLRSNEASRISNEMRNRGYFDVSPNNFSKFFAYDTTNHLVDMNMIIYPPDEDSTFKKYYIKDIYIYMGYQPEIPVSAYMDTLIDGYHFKTVSEHFIMKPKFVLEKMAVHPGDLYTYRDYRKTLLQLNILDIFKTPRILVQKVPGVDTLLEFHIQLVKDKKYQDEFSLENFVSSFSQSDLLLGASLHGGRQIKNLLNGSETFNINLSGSYETTFTQENNQSITTLGLNSSVQAPRYRDWGTIGLIRLIPGSRSIITDRLLSDFNTLGETYFSVNVNFEDIQQFYQTTSLQLSRGVRLTRNNHEFNIIFQNFDLLSPVKKNDFDSIVPPGSPYALSFEKQLITGFLFRSANWNYNAPRRKSLSYSMFLGIESSGHEIAALNLIPNVNLRSIKFTSDEFRFSQFFKIEMEPKLYWYLNRKSTLAFRLGTGIAIPYGHSTSVPYSELFSLGGSYSLRAWRNRQVGPGMLNNLSANIPFAADQFKFEFSTEYRFDLGLIMEGAVFAETGNVWSLGSIATSATKPSMESLAVDAGIGIRLDLTFFIFRFDLATPVRNWYPDEIDGSYWTTSSLRRLTSGIRGVIGLNYPF